MTATRDSRRLTPGQIERIKSYSGVKVAIQLSGVTSGTSLTFTAKDHFGPGDTSGVNVLATPALTANGTTFLTIARGAPVTANRSANDIVGEFFSVSQSGTVGTATVSVRATFIA